MDLRFRTDCPEPRLLPICLVLAMAPSIAIGQEAGPPAGEDPLAPLAYMVGGTWTAEGELPGFGEYTAERSYRRILDGRFIEQRHVLRIQGNEIETLGILGWDPDQATIVAWGFGNDGGIATTRADLVTADEIRLDGVRIGEFNPGPIRATFRRVSAEEFVEIAEMKRGDEWVPMFTFRFRRQ